MKGMMQKSIIVIVKFYQVAISPLIGRRCRFYPSCSAFCIQAVEKYGVIRGLYCSIRRLLKCNPFNLGGIEYVEAYEEDKGFILISSMLNKTQRFFSGGGSYLGTGGRKLSCKVPSEKSW